MFIFCVHVNSVCLLFIPFPFHSLLNVVIIVCLSNKTTVICWSKVAKRISVLLFPPPPLPPPPFPLQTKTNKQHTDVTLVNQIERFQTMQHRASQCGIHYTDCWQRDENIWRLSIPQMQIRTAANCRLSSTAGEREREGRGKDRQTDRQTERDRNRETETDRQTDRQAGRQADRQTSK